MKFLENFLKELGAAASSLFSKAGSINYGIASRILYYGSVLILIDAHYRLTNIIRYIIGRGTLFKLVYVGLLFLAYLVFKAFWNTVLKLYGEHAFWENLAKEKLK